MTDDLAWTAAEDRELRKARGAHVAWDMIEATFSTPRTKAALKTRYAELTEDATKVKRKPQRRWDEDEVARLKQLRNVDRLDWPAIDAALERTEGQSYNKYYQLSRATGARIRVSKFDRTDANDRTRAAIETREQARSLEPATLTAAILGDPLPGQSALDKISRARLAELGGAAP